MEIFFISFCVIVPAELADKTQLLALLLATRFRKPVPVILGMAAGLFVSHVASAFIGQWLAFILKGNVLHWLLSISLFAAAIWALMPDKMQVDEKEVKDVSHHNIFLTTAVSFIIAELGDKTQLATVALAAQFHDIVSVVLGTWAGMLAVNVPVVLLSHAIGDRIPLKPIRILSGILFAALGVYELSKIFMG